MSKPLSPDTLARLARQLDRVEAHVGHAHEARLPRHACQEARAATEGLLRVLAAAHGLEVKKGKRRSGPPTLDTLRTPLRHADLLTRKMEDHVATIQRFTNRAAHFQTAHDAAVSEQEAAMVCAALDELLPLVRARLPPALTRRAPPTVHLDLDPDPLGRAPGVASAAPPAAGGPPSPGPGGAPPGPPAPVAAPHAAEPSPPPFHPPGSPPPQPARGPAPRETRDEDASPVSLAAPADRAPAPTPTPRSGLGACLTDLALGLGVAVVAFVGAAWLVSTLWPAPDAPSLREPAPVVGEADDALRQLLDDLDDDSDGVAPAPPPPTPAPAAPAAPAGPAVAQPSELPPVDLHPAARVIDQVRRQEPIDNAALAQLGCRGIVRARVWLWAKHGYVFDDAATQRDLAASEHYEAAPGRSRSDVELLWTPQDTSNLDILTDRALALDCSCPKPLRRRAPCP